MAETFACGGFVAREQFRTMAFAQMTYRESLRDIEACLGAQPSKLYGMGLRGAGREIDVGRRERTARLAHVVGPRRCLDPPRAQTLCDDDIGIDLANTVYALDSTTIDLCLVAVSVGRFSFDQSGGQNAHAA